MRETAVGAAVLVQIDVEIIQPISRTLNLTVTRKEHIVFPVLSI